MLIGKFVSTGRVLGIQPLLCLCSPPMPCPCGSFSPLAGLPHCLAGPGLRIMGLRVTVLLLQLCPELSWVVYVCLVTLAEM